MKFFLRIAAVWLSVPLLSVGQVLLQQGESYTFEFTHFDFQGGGLPGPSARVGLRMRADTGFDGTDAIRFEAFESSTNEPALFTTNLVAGAGEPDFSFGAAWQDLRGVFRVTMLSGSATLADFFGSVITPNGNLYSLKVGGGAMFPPRLTVSRVLGGELKLVWSTNMVGCQLEMAGEVLAPKWISVSNTVVLEGDHYSVTVRAAEDRRFFRLRK